MPDQKLSQLPIAGTLQNTHLLYGEQDGLSVGVLIGDLKTAITAGVVLNGMTTVATISAIAAISSPANGATVVLTQAGREGIFIFSNADLSLNVTKDPQQGLYVAPSGASTGASGAWVRKYEGAINARWFGMSPTASASVNNTALQAALFYMESTAAAGSFNNFGFTNGSKGGGKLFIPRGLYNLSAAIDIFSTVIIEGEGGYDAGGGVTCLQWAAGTSGFRVQRYNTSGDSAWDSTDHNDGSGSIIRNMWLRGSYSGTEAECHGVHFKARVMCESVTCTNWQGDGFRGYALAGSHGAFEGNANSWRINNCIASACRNGLFLQGDNTNAGMSLGFNSTSCRQWGIFDSSFLANQHIGFHLDSNGQNPLNMATFSGKIYACVVGQETWCSTNAPTGTNTDNQGWMYHADGGVGAYGARTWTSGLTWRAGGPICCDDANAPHIVSGYVESGQPPAMMQQPTLIVGNGFYGDARLYGSILKYDGIINATHSGDNMGLVSPGALLAQGRGGVGVLSNGALNRFGPQLGAAADSTMYLDNRNIFSHQQGRAFNSGGVPTDLGYLQYRLSSGVIYAYLQAGYQHIFRGETNNDLAYIENSGVSLPSGKVLKANGNQVVSVRKTGWALATGTATRSTFDTTSITLPQLAEHVKALIDDLHSTAGHGLIGP